MLRPSPAVGSPMLGSSLRHVDVVERVPAGRLCLDDSCTDAWAKSPQLQRTPQLQNRLRQFTPRSPSVPRNSTNDFVEHKGKEWAPVDACRNLFGEVGSEVEPGPNGQMKPTWRSQSANLHQVPCLSEKAEDCMDTVSTERGGGRSKTQEEGGDLRTRLFRHVNEERNARIHETTRLQLAINELRERLSVSVRDAVDAAEARLAAQFLTAIVPSYDELRKRVGALESRILDVPDPPSARAHEGRDSHGQMAEHLPLVWPEQLGDRIAALEERSERISALEQAVADLRLPLVALESRREVQLTARSEPMCEALSSRIATLELQYATGKSGRLVSDAQEAINASERRLLDELQAMRAENTERVQVLSSQLLDVRVAALQAQVLQNDCSISERKAADSKPQPTEPAS